MNRKSNIELKIDILTNTLEIAMIMAFKCCNNANDATAIKNDDNKNIAWKCNNCKTTYWPKFNDNGTIKDKYKKYY